MNNSGSEYIHPKLLADKSSKDNFKKAISMALNYESDAVRPSIQNFNDKRYQTIAKLSDYESLKDQARAIKEKAIESLPQLIELITENIEKRGGKVFLARTKEEANQYIRDVCTSHDAKLVVKAKSITSEEIQLNPVLESAGIEVAETDLAEFILQISGEQPSHIVVPAIHRDRASISELFKSHFNTDMPLDTGEHLTKFARDILRQKFLSADVGISGANMLAAESGTILLVESEGNIRLTTQLPAVHIALAGIEKIVPSMQELSVFIELLAASATGQRLSSYTNILNPPLDLPVLNLNGRNDTAREFHLVLIDNGRMAMRDDPELRETLYCIRCSACLNSCANFQAVGGHAFGGEAYSGGIGASWTVGTSGQQEQGRFAELCTGCTRCAPNCPVRIDIPWLNTVIKQRLLKKSWRSRLQKKFFAHFAHLAKMASLAPGMSNLIGNLSVSRWMLNKLVGFSTRRYMPQFALKTLVEQYRTHRRPEVEINRLQERELVLFADVYTNYNNPNCGMTALKILDRLGIKTTLSDIIPEGRAAQSQGLLDLASKRAIRTADYLEQLIDSGKDIIVTEPSVLALFRRDYQKQIHNDDQFNKLKENCYDVFEYLNRIFAEHELNPNEYFDLGKSKTNTIFYHEHCQMKTIDPANNTHRFFKNLGMNVVQSHVECCGMAGSFGYKEDYYELSKRVGDDLIAQIEAAGKDQGDLIVLASGTSCREQLHNAITYKLYHPIEYLAGILR